MKSVSNLNTLSQLKNLNDVFVDVYDLTSFDFIQNLPVFIPVSEMGNYFRELVI